MRSGRLWHGVVALLALAGLGIQFYGTLVHRQEPLAERVLIYFSYFTILTNMLVMAVSLAIARQRGPFHRWAAKPATRTMVSLHITMVAVIYQLLLAKYAHLTPLGWWGNLLVHQIVPGMWLTGWAVFLPHGGIGRHAPWRWLAYPLAYGGWTLVHGALDGWYPYPFLNVTKLGLAMALRNMALMALFFVALGFAFRWMDGALGRQRRYPRQIGLPQSR